MDNLAEPSQHQLLNRLDDPNVWILITQIFILSDILNNSPLISQVEWGDCIGGT